MSDTIFTFRNGHQLWAKDDYSPHLRDLAIERWREGNPSPIPPEIIKTVPVKSGSKEIAQKNWNDPTFQALLSMWMSDLRRYQEDITIFLAVDREKIDRELIAKARTWSTHTNISLPSDDVQLYIHLVADPTKRDDRGKPDVNGKSEMARVASWLDSLQGPSEALIEQFRSFHVQIGSNTPGDNDGHLGLSHSGQPKPASRTKTTGANVQMADLQIGSE